MVAHHGIWSRDQRTIAKFSVINTMTKVSLGKKGLVLAICSRSQSAKSKDRVRTQSRDLEAEIVCFLFETGSHCVALIGPELLRLTSLVQNSQRGDPSTSASQKLRLKRTPPQLALEGRIEVETMEGHRLLACFPWFAWLIFLYS